MDSQIFQLHTHQIRRNASQAVLNAPDGIVVTIKPRTRSGDQNAMLHAIFSAVAKQAKWGNRTLTAVQWKSIFISGHASATGLGSDLVPGIEGEFVNIRESSASMSIARMTSLIEYVLAWCAENEIAVNHGVMA